MRPAQAARKPGCHHQHLRLAGQGEWLPAKTSPGIRAEEGILGLPTGDRRARSRALYSAPGPRSLTPPSRQLQEGMSFHCLHFTLVESEAHIGPPTCTGPRGGWSRLGGRRPGTRGEGAGQRPGGRGAGEAPTVESGPGSRARGGGLAGITCCGGRRSAAAGHTRAPGSTVPEVAVGPPAGSPGRPSPIGAVYGPEEAGGA